ncbi:MAG TPA: SOS response-associated peptidase, partial [Holophagaceae bacterium]|nr:SOS response-associated peptidase [Holophagaceae bacterium]
FQVGLKRKAEQEERLVLDEKVRDRIQDRYNIAPGQEVFTVHQAGDHWGAAFRTWGVKQSHPRDLINSRDDTMQAKPGYFASFQRILVPVSGFYEWPSLAGRKRAYAIRPVDHDALWWFAGLMKVQEGVERFSIMTTAPPEGFHEIHDRWPMTLHPEDRDRWLDPGLDRAELFALMQPPPAEWVDAYEVGPAVGNWQSEGLSLVEPLK